MQSFINETPGHLLDYCGYSTSIHPIANTAHNRRWAGGYPAAIQQEAGYTIERL